MKKTLFVLMLLSLWGAEVQAADIWFKQAASGAGTGASCTDARALSSHAIGDDVGDNILHLCPGTFTGTAGATGFTSLASGTSGHPITLKFESGAVMQAPYWSAAIDLSNKSWWVVDGGTTCGYVNGADVACNGTIKNTASGTGLANINPTCPAHGDGNCNGVHIGIGSSHIEVKNLEIGPLYLRTTLTTNSNGGKVKAIYSEPGTQTDIHIHNNQITDAQAAIFFAYCGLTNFEVDHNTTNNHVWGVGMLDSNSGCTAGTGSVHHNHIGDFLKWSAPMGGDVGFHFDGIILSSNETGTVFSNTDVYDNFYDGAMDINGTGFIYLTSEFGTMTTGMKIYNEVIHPRLPGNNNGFPGDGLITLGFTSISSVFNNTIISCYATDSVLIRETGTKVLAFRNNIISGDTCGSPFVAIHNKNGANLSGGIFTNNNYFNLNPSRAFEIGDGTTFFSSLSSWQSACNCDSSSVVGNPNLSTAFVPGSGSSAINLGLNLTSLGIATLNNDASGNARPTGSTPWTAGAKNTSSATPGLTMSPNPAAFGNVTVGANSSPITVTVTSNGSSTATLGSPVATFSDPQFSNVGTGTCVINQSLPPGSSCTIIIRFTPSSAGAKSGTMLAGANTSASINLSGTGVSLTPTVSISPSPVAFGSITTGTTSAAQTVTVTNTGTGTLNLANPFFAISGTDASSYSRTGGTCANSGTVAPAASCTLTVTFHPTTVGAKTGVLTINGNATGTANLTGTGVSPATPIVTITPSPVAFGNQVQSTTSSAITVTITNTGAATLTLATPFFVLAGANPTNFARSSGTCSDGGTVAASASCTILVTFTPSILGARSATLTINGNATGSVSLTGTGIAPATPVITITPSPIAFGNQTQGTTSSALTVTVANTGSASLILSTPFFTLTGTNAADFARTGGTCSNGGTVTAASSCTVLLTFTPATTAAESATLNISGNVNGSAPITGTGVAVAITSMSATPATWDFGTVPQGTTSTPKQFIITNTGTTSLTLAGPPFTTFSGANPTDFMLGTGGGDTCASGTILTAGQTCTKTLQGVPSIVGAESATATFNATTTTATASLTMTGQTTASLLITPRPVPFPVTTIGTTSAAVTATVTNNGAVSETLATPFFTLTGTNAADFTKTGGTCSNGLVLAATVTCTVTLTFTPTINGPETANLNVTSNLASNSVTINGTGAIPTPLPGIALSPSGGVSFGSQVVGTASSVQTVTVSSTGTGNLILNTPYFTLTGTNAADVTNTGAGSCVNGGTLAPGSTCTITLTFNPAGAGARTATLNVNGNASASLGITGTGVAQVVTLTAAPSPVAFGNVTQSTVSATQTVTITNTGNITATLATPYYTLTGTNSADFANLGSGTCANGGTLAVAATCTIKLTFTPSLLIAETATLTVNGSLASTVADSLTGTGVAPLVPSINLSPDPVAFPNTNVGSTSTGITVTVSNNGSATLNLSTPFYTVSGANPTDFTRSAGTCIDGGTVAVSASCTIVLNFAPAAAGSRTATLNIAGNASKSVNITGTGVATAAILTLTPNPLNYGVVIQGSSSITTMTLQNTGTQQTTLLTPFISITGANALDFTRLGGTCINGQILAINQSCTILLAFTPSTNTAETATVTVFAAFSVTGTATLNGTGQARPNSPAPSVLIISKLWVRDAFSSS